MTKPILYLEGDEEIALPCRWAICDCCDGHGKTSRHVERDGGGFTASEWAEEDPDFREDYMAGRYDRACDECGGSGKVEVVDEARMTPEHIAAWHQQCREDAEMRAIERAERRMGA